MDAIDLPDPDATFELGVALGRKLAAGDFVGLSGDLGAGKTLLVRGVAVGLGCPAGQVQSPTFTLVNSYAGGRLVLHHADLYRVETADELYATGYFDLVGGAGAMLVEWVERIPGAAPDERLDVRFERTGESSRRLQLEAHGARPAGLLADLVG